MKTLAVLTPSLFLRGGLEGWRRTTGIMRAHAALAPLPLHIHPEDIDGVQAAIELAEYRDASVVARIGSWEQRVPCRLLIGRWTAGQAPLEVEALRPLPISAWWLDARRYAESPALPSTLRA